MPTPNLPADAWVEITPTVTSLSSNRSPDLYTQVCKQFDVGHSPRYQRNVKGFTMCNIFLWDVTVAMHCEIPHWVDPTTGSKTLQGKGAELSANGVCDWLATHASKFGWALCNEARAMDRATQGFPTCVVWKNPGGIGHVAVVLPGTDYCHIAQAGGTNFFDQPLVKGFGGIPNLLFYTHD